MTNDKRDHFHFKPFSMFPNLQHRSFRIDTVNNQFVMDERPFRIIAGSFHYFRALPETWQRKLRTMRAAGLNAVTTYVEWSLHNPKYGNYTWDGMADLERFIQLARQEDLYVILRPGPYICAERDLVIMPCIFHRQTYVFTNNVHFSFSLVGWTSILATRQISDDQTTHQRCKYDTHVCRYL